MFRKISTYTLFYLLLFFAYIKSFGQPCGDEYSSGFYHNPAFVSLNGDTMNKLDSNGYYEGLHVYTDNENNLFNKKIEYTIGHYHHGQPIGDWMEHCSDGTFSIGQYESGIESISDGKGGYIEKKQGIYAKIGIWKYFDKDSNLIKTMRYERWFDKTGWTKKIYLKDKDENFILIKSEFTSRCEYPTSSTNVEIIVLPAVGIIYNNDSFLIAKNLVNDIINRIDSNSNDFEIHYSQNIFSDFCVRSYTIKSTELKKRKYKKRGSYSCAIIFNKLIVLNFAGHYIDSLFLNDIVINYPVISKTNDSLEIGMNFEKIFEKYPKIEGSYNSCSLHYCYYYPEQGISFYVNNDKECDMFQKINGFEIFKGQKN